MTASTRIAAQEALEARFAARMAAALRAQSEQLPHDVAERLRASREQALSRRRRRPAAAAMPVLVGSAHGAGLLARPSPWWLKMASGLPALLLVAGLLLIGYWDSLEQVQAAAEIDAVLLADELPPRAYADPGFVEYLKAPPNAD